MERTVIAKTLFTGKTAINEAGTIGSGYGGQAREWIFHVVARGTVTAGKVKIEAAHDPDYTGAWALIGAEITLATDTVAIVSTTGAHRALRARISTAVTGGAVVDAYLTGN